MRICIWLSVTRLVQNGLNYDNNNDDINNDNNIIINVIVINDDSIA